MTNNVVPFPGMEEKLKQQVIEELDQIGQKQKHYNLAAIDETTAALIETVLLQMKMMGHDDPINAPYNKEICFVVESIRSMVSKMYGQSHVLQDIADSTIEISNETGGTYFFVEPLGLIAPKKES